MFTVFRFVEETGAPYNPLRAKDISFYVQLCEVGPFSDYASYTAHQIQGFLSNFLSFLKKCLGNIFMKFHYQLLYFHIVFDTEL